MGDGGEQESAQQHLYAMDQLRAAHADLYRDKTGQTDLLWERLWTTTNAEYGSFAARHLQPQQKQQQQQCYGDAKATAGAGCCAKTGSCRGGQSCSAAGPVGCQRDKYEQTSADYGAGCTYSYDDYPPAELAGDQQGDGTAACCNSYDGAACTGLAGTQACHGGCEYTAAECGGGGGALPPSTTSGLRESNVKSALRRRQRVRDPLFNPAQQYVEECCGRMWASLHGV